MYTTQPLNARGAAAIVNKLQYDNRVLSILLQLNILHKVVSFFKDYNHKGPNMVLGYFRSFPTIIKTESLESRSLSAITYLVTGMASVSVEAPEEEHGTG